jgi:hypothetical protein
MDVHVGEVRSVVRVADPAAPGPVPVEEIVSIALARLREELAHERRLEDERLLRPAVSASESRAWERT